MAEGHNRLAEYKAELDRISAGVMPDKWEGHGRLKIEERGFDADRRSFARRLLAKLNDKYPEKDAEKLATVAIEKTEEKFD